MNLANLALDNPVIVENVFSVVVDDADIVEGAGDGILLTCRDLYLIIRQDECERATLLRDSSDAQRRPAVLLGLANLVILEILT